MTIEDRFEKLEKELAGVKRRHRWLLTGAGLIAAGIGLAWLLTRTTADAAAAPKEIRANSFIVVDENNKPRVMLMVNKNGTALVMLDEHDKPRIGMGVTRDGPGLNMYDEDGKAIWGSR